MAAARTMGVKLRSGLSVLVLLACVSFVSSRQPALQDGQQTVQVSYFSNSDNFGFRAELSEEELAQQKLDVLRIKNEIDSALGSSSNDAARPWTGMQNSPEQQVLVLRKKRDTTQVSTSQSVPENQTGLLVDFRNDFPNLRGRQFSLNSTSKYPEMFEVTSGGQLRLRDGHNLDYEVTDMRSITFIVHATRNSDPTDVYEITVDLTVTDVNEPPVFKTEPQPYLATVRTNTGPGFTIITLVATDPEGAPVQYDFSVQSSQYNNRIELRTETVDGVRRCQLRTQGSSSFVPEGGTFSITVNAKDAENGGRVATTTVNVKIGVRPPQFYQGSYQGAMSEKNVAQQTVYKLGTSEELKVEWKTFQQGVVTLSLTGEGGSASDAFEIQRGPANTGYILNSKKLNYEEVNPKTQALTLTATQRVGNVDLSSSVSVTVEVQDANDNKPVFDSSQYLKPVEENVGVGSTILQVTARDKDTGLNAQIDYSLMGTEDFEIVTSAGSGNPPIYTGAIKVKRKLDYDRPEGPYYIFQVKATDRGTPPQTSTSNIRITVSNVNDESPQFLDAGTTYTVQEDAQVNQFIGQIQATDGDGDKVTYSFTDGGLVNQKFKINAETGVLTLNQMISDSDDLFELSIRATDDGRCCGVPGSSSRSNDTTFYVQVYGINSERPDFKICSSYGPSVDENSDIGTSVIQVTATDNDRGPNGKVSYSFSQPQELFNINSTTGLITVSNNIDREAISVIQVTVKAEDGGNPRLEGYCAFRVTVNDVNDHTPLFNLDRYVRNITVNQRTSVPVLFVRASDDDVGNNARIVYSLPDDAEGRFSVLQESGSIYLTQPLQSSDVGQSFSLTAMAMDKGSPPRNSTVGVRVNVETGQNEPPSWDKDYKSMTYDVKETVGTGYEIVNMTCSSNIADRPGVEFQLIKEDGSTGTRTDFFYVTPVGNTAIVRATGKFDYTKRTEHEIRIRCLNLAPVTLISVTNPKVLLIDTNNQIPEFQGLAADGRYAGSVQENKPSGTSVATVQATDKDSTSPYNEVTFSILQGSDNFTIDNQVGQNSAVIRTRIEFDRETVDNYLLIIKATDGAPSSRPGEAGTNRHNTATVYMNVKITDVNDNAPYFNTNLFKINVSESQYINDLIDPAIEVQDPDASDEGRHTYQIVNGNTNNAFGIRNGLGNLFPLRKLDFEQGDKEFSLVVEASDGKFTATTTVSVTVQDMNDNSPVFGQSVYRVDNVTEEDPNYPTKLLTLSATDADVNRPNSLTYYLEGSSFVVKDFFEIDKFTGELSLINKLDRDLPDGRATYQFTVKAADELTDPNFGYATVSVTPKDINDNPPRFVTEPLVAYVQEDSPNGTSVKRIEAEDYDEGLNGTVVFTIENIVDGSNVARPDYFHIDPSTGVVTTNTTGNNLDRETVDTYRLTILLQDKGSPPMQTSGVLTVTLTDKNDQPPIFQHKIYRTDMSENLQSGEVIRVVATDNDIGENAKISYVLVGPDDSRHFSVKDIDNEGSVQIETPVDYEVASQRKFNLTVKAQDNAGLEDTCYVEITVLDFNDHAPDIQPKTLTRNVSEAAPPGTFVGNFSATDADATDINKEFEFSISRASNPMRHFSIDAVTGEVKVRRRLDRETKAVHELTIQAIDKGNPPLMGTASLTVIVEDVNDNYPTFKEDYNPHVMENEGKGVSRVVQEVLAKDPDADPYGAPFGFMLGSCQAGECNEFQFRNSSAGDGGNGSATVSTSSQFDREAKKQYLIPIVMWDMRGKNSNQAMTGTNTLTITIADENDNPVFPGTQDIFVYNYEGKFGPVDIGRVYAEDQDDWDLPDKVFNYTGVRWMASYFTVDYNTGMITMNKGVPSNSGKAPYEFTVKVQDVTRNEAVTSKVRVTVEDLSEEAVRNSGATRFKGTSAEAFIKVPKSTATNSNPQSASQQFRTMLADKLNTDEQNVQIISIQDVEGGFTDVRYAVHGSPYYQPSQTDSIVVLNKADFEQKLGVGIEEVPIDACAEEVFEGGCYNYMDITGNPALVNANGTSFVGVEVFILAREGCRALDFPEPNECSGNYCYHGGTCVKNDFGVLSCINCPDGFDGPRCQQLRHSFDGKSYAMYPTLEQCEDSETSIEFITTQPDGMLLYNGPMTQPDQDKPQDFISLELAGGLPVLHIDHGSGSATLTLEGRDQSGSVVIEKLNDGKWHKINIIRKGKHVEMIVDDCKAAGPSATEDQPPDTRPCRTSATTRGENSFLNVATLLQVGGRAPGHNYPASGVVSGTGFNGCVKNLMHNSKYYDLHYKQTSFSGENGCPREDKVCEEKNCGANGICTAVTLAPPVATCTCRPQWRGDTCSIETQIRDLRSDSFLQWQLLGTANLPPYQLEVQVMYRTWDTDGVLFTISTPNNTKRVTMELRDGRLQALYNLDDEDHTLLLNDTKANDGYWHVARFKRVMDVATLTLDHGEGRNHVSRRDPGSNVYMRVTSRSPVYGGASVTNPSGAQVLDRDLANTCVRDFRLNGHYLPIKGSENTEATIARYDKEKNVNDGCRRADGCVPQPVPPCPVNTVCVNIWGRHICKCAKGYHDTDSGVCQSDCLPDNPCFMDMPCSIQNGSVHCNCTRPWYGDLCNLYPTEKDEPSVGIAGSTIAAIVVSILLVLILVLIVFFLVNYYMRRKNRDEFDKFVVEDDADFDIRENVIFYDEEGAGEEDQNAFDLTKLPTPGTDSVPMGPPREEMPRSRIRPLGRGVPDDRPDVGDVLHDRLGDADDDPDAPPHDTLITFNEEGAGSDAGSLSSLGSSSSDASQDYDYLNDWGPKFAKLADMYGAGQE